jgi:hypothetical protein
VRELDADRHRRPAADRGEHRDQRRLVGVGPQAEVGGVDPALGHDRARFEDQ